MKYNVLGIGHAISDIEIGVEHAYLSEHGLAKGGMVHIDEAERARTLNLLKVTDLAMTPGGSVANTLGALAKLGKACCFIGNLGDDAIGKKYAKTFKELSIAFPFPVQVGGKSGSCLIFITPDAERTMMTTLGCSTNFTLTSEHLTLFQNASLLYIEGYLLENPQTTAAVRKAIEMAKALSIPIALSASNHKTIERHFYVFQELLQKVDIFFANEEELKALCVPFKKDIDLENSDQHQLMHQLGHALNRRGLFLIGTLGKYGSYLWDSRQTLMKEPVHIAAVPTKVVDTTGAGDAYAAGILKGILDQTSLETMGHEAAMLASTVISRFSARY